MSQTNVIITSGSKNQIIHVPVVTSTTRTAKPIEIVTSQSGSLTIKQISDRNSDRNFFSPTKQINPFSPPFKSGVTNRELFANEDNSEIKTIYFNSDSNKTREQLLLPTDTYIKEEIEDDEYEEYESLDEEDVEDIEGVLKSKTQYKCSGCSKGFCYPGWLDKHKQSSPACRNAHPIAENNHKQPINYSPAASLKERTSLEGRLSELLCCPNENCNFSTHWVQSLNKHVFTACKFKNKDNNKEDSSKTAFKQNSNDDQSLNACHLCNKSFSDTEQHIQHMKNVHQIKLLYQCSECKMNFDTKSESETHIAEHNSRRERANRITPNVENGSQQCWTCESCNKTYLSIRSYEIHRTSCEKSVPSVEKSINRSTNNSVKTSSLRPQQKSSSIKHFRREQIEAIHDYDFRCKFFKCKKKFDSSNGLCNHLSRRPSCRDWYYTNLPIELKKRNSLHLMPSNSRRLQLESNERNSFSSPMKLSTDSSSSMSRPSKPDRQRSVSYESTPNSVDKTNSARCNKCRKIFVGKNPTVALTNHLRGSNTCIPMKYNSSGKPQVVRSRTLAKDKISRTRNPNLGENRFYCKLCPENMKLKNRVSLGCHLTIYHSLPQVSVSTENGTDAFRCQTCSKIFESKYFYNVHRQDCDLTSPYVGIVSNDELLNDGSDEMFCNLCGRTGFPTSNQLSIHQKYQCIKRNQNKAVQPKRFQAPLRTQKPVHRQMTGLNRINDNEKSDTALRCDECGKGPYHSYSHMLEHKKKYCNALKGVNVRAVGSKQDSNRAKKTFIIETNSYDSAAKENFCLNPTVPRARKTINFANVSSPQVSHDSSAPMDTNENEAEEVVLAVPQITKCSVCPEEFEDILAFIRHRLGHITEELTINEMVEAIECELCGARVHHYQRIQQHLILHLQNVQILKKKNLVEVMKKSHHKQYENESDEEDMDGSVLQCPYCKSEYLSRAELAEHIKKTCPFRYQCPNCSNTYSAKESYLEHREYCSKNTNNNKIAPKAPTYKCRNCSLEFQIKQQLLWHEHACNKVYAADHSGRVEEVIERTLTCSVCGLVSDVYERKVRHETQCLKRYLAVIGNTTEDIESNGEDITKPITKMDFDLTSLSNTSESNTSEVPEEVINNLKEEYGIQKELKVVLTGFDEEVIRKLKTDLYRERDETTQFEALKESFRALVRRLTKNDEILFEMSQEASAEVVLSRMLKYLGEEPIRHNGLNELNCFRQNLQTFLKLTIKDDTLVLAYRDAESVDEAIVNMLNFECEFNC